MSFAYRAIVLTHVENRIACQYKIETETETEHTEREPTELLTC